MDRISLTEKMVGENLDSLMNLDPRGYGVCRILYEGSKAYAGGNSTSMTSAKKLVDLLNGKTEDSVVLIMTGFVLRPHLMPETDGIVGALLFARALITAFGITPVLSINEKNVPAVKNCAAVMGLHVYSDVETACKMPLSFGYVTVPVDKAEAEKKIGQITAQIDPVCVFSTECAGANALGEYHNAVGMNMTELESKQDGLFQFYKNHGVCTFAVGDLGNEIGMGAILPHLKKFIPYVNGEGNGIAAVTAADYLVTATVSDWGVYAIIGAVAFLKKDISILHDEKMEEAVLRQCCLSGMVDMTGSLLPAIDGFSVEIEKQIVALMRSTVEYAIGYENQKWFDVVLEKGFYG